MRRSKGALLLILVFSGLMGALLWKALLGPPYSQNYFIENDGFALAGPEPDQKNLYLRRVFFLTQQPSHAWLQVIGRDRLRVYVNGELLTAPQRDGYSVGVILDVTSKLRIGINVIAVTVRQATVGERPLAAVEGSYVTADGRRYWIRSDDQWRSNHFFERNANWWFSPEFEDRHWRPARLLEHRARAHVAIPPQSLQADRTGQWMLPSPRMHDSIALRREFLFPGRPTQAWLGVTTKNNYVLAVNGTLVDRQEDELSSGRPVEPIRRVYDITSYMEREENVVAILLTNRGEPPAILVEGEVEDRWGRQHPITGDDQWLISGGRPADWLDRKLRDPSGWFSYTAQLREFSVPPEQIGFQEVPVVAPLSTRLYRLAGQLSVMFGVAVLTLLVCPIVARNFSRLGIPGSTAYLALVLPSAAAFTILLLSYDLRISRQALFHEGWIFLAAASVPFQWSILGILGSIRERKTRRLGSLIQVPRKHNLESLKWVLLAGLMAVGFGLRAQYLTVEPLKWDEVENYQYTMGFFERGFPSRQVHPDLPVAYVHTSELTYFFNALVAIFSENERLIVRLPSALFSSLIILLIYLAGSRMFSPNVGMVSALLFSLSPVCIAMSNVGRYFSQLQFFTLLTVLLFWIAIRGNGPINRRAMIGSALSFLAMFLTWEGSAFLAVGMVAALLLARRNGLQTLLKDSHAWMALFIVLTGVVLQYSHVVLEQTQFLWYGTSLSDLRLKRMWTYSTFQPWFYLWHSSWLRDAFLPVVTSLAAIFVGAHHPFGKSTRFLLLVLGVNCLFMASFLPAMAWRYGHHLIPFMILLAAASVVALSHWLYKVVTPPKTHPWTLTYARSVATLIVLLFVTLASGWTVQLEKLPQFRVDGFTPGVLKFPDLENPAQFVRRHLREGDVVLATDPFQVRHLMRLDGAPFKPEFYWTASVLQLSATLDDRRPIPLDRRDGTPMLSDLASFANLFASNRRIWYVAQPLRHENQNLSEVSAFLRHHMVIVFEDFESLVLLRDVDTHRPASIRRADERNLHAARANYLPEASLLVEE